MSVAADLARASVLTLIVFELGVIDIRSTRAILTALTDRRVPAASVLPVANRYRKRSPMLSLEDARDALGGIAIGRVSNDFSSVIRSINYGQPVAKVAPRSALRNDIREIVTLVEAQISQNGSKR
jgi:Flp pilus assembly CpaE family ATPase